MDQETTQKHVVYLAKNSKGKNTILTPEGEEIEPAQWYEGKLDIGEVHEAISRYLQESDARAGDRLMVIAGPPEENGEYRMPTEQAYVEIECAHKSKQR